MPKRVLLSFLIMLFYVNCYSQHETSGWLFLSHTQKLNSQWDLLADIQTRSADKIAYINTLLLRTAVQFNLNKVHSVAFGYAYKRDWIREELSSNGYEHRVYEQYQANFNLDKIEANTRLRLEQRFVNEKPGNTQYSQRGRVFLSAKIPIFANQTFSKGLYTNLQNEIFLNLQHRDRVNNKILDQNRSQLSVGYRWNEKLDTDFGYQFWHQLDKEVILNTNVFQIMISTHL